MPACALSLADLESFDRKAPKRRRGKRERRFLCPLADCSEKKRDQAHRSLSLNTETGEWRCWRCGACGKLKDFWEEYTPRRREERARRELRRRLDGAPPTEAALPGNQAWRRELKGVVPLPGTDGARYLEGRGIPLAIAQAARVRFHPAFYESEGRCGRPAVVFPAYHSSGELEAAEGRYTDGGDPPEDLGLRVPLAGLIPVNTGEACFQALGKLLHREARRLPGLSDPLADRPLSPARHYGSPLVSGAVCAALHPLSLRGSLVAQPFVPTSWGAVRVQYFTMCR